MTYSKLLIFVLGTIFYSCKESQKKPVQVTDKAEKEVTVVLEKLWETDTLLTTCEAVRYNAEENIIYVSNIGQVPPDKKDEDGSISILNKEGKIINQNWVTGISAPKGSNYFNGKLYVTNIDEIVKIDMKSGKIDKKYAVENAIFLNDIDIDKNGDVFFTDSRASRLYKLVNDEVSLWLDLKGVNPNGILVEKDRVLVASYSKGDFIAIDKQTKKRTVLATGIVGGDGIEPIDEGYIISTWPGEIFFVGKNQHNNKAVKILDTKKEKLNAADIGIIPNENILLVPTFFGNKVMAYKINLD